MRSLQLCKNIAGVIAKYAFLYYTGFPNSTVTPRYTLNGLRYRYYTIHLPCIIVIFVMVLRGMNKLFPLLKRRLRGKF